MTQKTPVVAITSHWDRETDRYGVRRRYFASLAEAGAAPLLLPVGIEPGAMLEILRRVDGVLLSGGEDIEPSLYGEERDPRCGAACPERDAAEKLIVETCLAENKPLFGICRGMQAMNVFTGGTLIQDIPSAVNGALNHSQPEHYTSEVHAVRAIDPLFERITGAREIMVNTSHHQSCAKPGRGVRYLAESVEDGVIESMVIEGHPYAMAVQWHPEMMANLFPVHMALFTHFVEGCRGNERIG